MSYKNESKKLIIGLLIALIDIHIDDFNILPDFIGYIIVFIALITLKSYHNFFRRAKYSAAILILLSSVQVLSEYNLNVQLSLVLSIPTIVLKMFLYYYILHAIKDIVFKKGLHATHYGNIEFAWKSFFYLSLVIIFVVVFQILKTSSPLSSVAIIMHFATEAYLIFLINKLSRT